MPIIKNRDAAFNYGCLMAELKEKMALFRSRLNKDEGESSESLLETKLEDESKIGNGSLISENELDSVLREKFSSKNVFPSDGLTEKIEEEVMVESGVDNEDECRISLSSDSKVFPYPICFVSKSLPTPPKDYNLRKTGIDLNTSSLLEYEDMTCNRVSRKLMFLVEKERNGGKEEWWKFREDSNHFDKVKLTHNQNLENNFDRENNYAIQSTTIPFKCDNSKENKDKKTSQDKLSLIKTFSLSQQSERDAIQKEVQAINKSKLSHKSHSIENIKNSQENKASKSENSKHLQTKPLFYEEKNNISYINNVNNSNEFNTRMKTVNNTNSIISDSIYKNEDQINRITTKKKNPLSQQRINTITTRYFKMAPQLRVIY